MKSLDLLLTHSFKDKTSNWLETAAFNALLVMAVEPFKRGRGSGTLRHSDCHTPSVPGVTYNQQRGEHILGPAPGAINTLN